VPGDQLVLELEAVRIRARTALVRGRAMVGADVACEADITYMMVDKPTEPVETSS
jgi:3-hydroxymyristoyl/3-hydroxydecanoyl-(acyl carrier protein) dehydratase